MCRYSNTSWAPLSLFGLGLIFFSSSPMYISHLAVTCFTSYFCARVSRGSRWSSVMQHNSEWGTRSHSEHHFPAPSSKTQTNAWSLGCMLSLARLLALTPNLCPCLRLFVCRPVSLSLSLSLSSWEACAIDRTLKSKYSLVLDLR